MGRDDRKKKHGDAKEREKSATPSNDLKAAVRQAVESRVENFRIWLGTRYKSKFAAIEKESKARMAANEIALFSHPILQLGVFLGALLVFLSLLHYTAPPISAAQTLVGKDVKYVPDVELCFGIGCLEDPSRIHKVALPYYVEPLNFSDYQDHDLFYRIRPEIGENLIREGKDTLFAPIIWGEAEVYRSGELMATGPNFWLLIPLKGYSDQIVVHVKRPSGQKIGIRGTFPPIVIGRDLARSLENEFQSEFSKFQYAFVAQLSGMCLLLIMFLTFPYRPELFAFLVLFGIETTRSWLLIIYDMGLVFQTPRVDEVIHGLLCVMGGLAGIFFIGLFFRRSFYALALDIWNRLGVTLIFLLIGYLGLASAVPALPSENALFMVVWMAAFWLSLMNVRGSLLYLIYRGLNLRLLLGLSALGATGYWVGHNVSDYLNLLFPSHKITSTYQNHLHFFFVMATILGIEIGRTEIKIKQAFSFLPKEVVRLIHDQKEEWREGFVVLVDVVGWTSKLNLLDGSETPTFMRKINEHLLSYFDEPNASVISGTGDGFYLTFEEAPTRTRFDKLESACVKLAQHRPTFREIGITHSAIVEEKLIVRSAIGYGRYYTGFAQTKHLKRDFIAGFLATLLARVLGNDLNPKGPRILMGSALDSFRSKPPSVQETKGVLTKYWQAGAG